ncbi:MAG: hypothetical protein SOZ95_01055 [Bacilli bacterium]|nr:hypothetical protein [Bacilli bacterium]
MIDKTQLRKKIIEKIINDYGDIFSVFEKYIDNKLINNHGKMTINKFEYINIMQCCFKKFTTKEYKTLIDAYNLFFKELKNATVFRVNDFKYDAKSFFKNYNFFDCEEANILFQCLKQYIDNDYIVYAFNDSIIVYAENF